MEIQHKTEQENYRNICYFNFPTLDFLVYKQDKRAGISKKISVILYPIFIHFTDQTRDLVRVFLYYVEKIVGIFKNKILKKVHK